MEPAEYQRMFDLEDRHWWFQSRLVLVRRLLKIHAPLVEGRQLRLLDLGCGTGMFLEREGPGRMAVGLDFSRRALTFARRRNVERLACGDSQRLPFHSDSFDLATAFDLIEHVNDDRALVREVARVLKPGGIFLATVPAHPFLWSQHDVALHHKRRYRKRAFEELFEDGRWARVRTSYCFSGIYPAAALIRSLRKPDPDGTEPAADTRFVNRWVDAMLIAWHHMENAWIARFNSPFGLSLVTIRRKRAR